MPCWEWLAEEVEWEQGSGPKGPMSCRTQGWISIRPEKAYLRPKEQFSMIFNGTFAFSQFFVMLPCYSMGISNCFHFSSIFHVIQWEICIFLLFCKFSMLFKGKFAFHQLSMLFNENLRLEKLWGGRMNVWTYGNSPLCPTGHRPFGAAALLSHHFFSYHSKQGIGFRWSCAIFGWLVPLCKFTRNP